jgi:hypothetical protein
MSKTRLLVLAVMSGTSCWTSAAVAAEPAPQPALANLAYKPWQDHLAATAERLVRGSGAKLIRLDELGGFYGPCHNPAHHHKGPFECQQAALDAYRHIREAVDRVDPDVVIKTEELQRARPLASLERADGQPS